MKNKISNKPFKWIKRDIYSLVILFVLTLLIGIIFKSTETILLKKISGVLFSLLGVAFTTITIIFPFILINRGIKYLFKAKNIIGLIVGYLVIIFVVIYLFAQIYSISGTLETGYLTRGVCSDNFNKSMISQDNLISNNYFYFSAITFFTVGYGDICPMGLNKEISIANALVGHIFTTIIIVLAISYFIESKKKTSTK